MIYHLLPELEVFSAYRGGALAKNIANIMRFDSSRMVVCHAADDTSGDILQIELWYFPSSMSTPECEAEDSTRHG